jgi:hypothetical protein
MLPADVQDIADALAQSQRRLQERGTAGGAAARLARLFELVGRRLVRPPRIVLLGEFNSGKTTLANALIGADVLPTSFHANTRVPIRVFHSASASVELEMADRSRIPLVEAHGAPIGQARARFLHVGLPVERLKAFELIDTPGLASGLADLAQLDPGAFGHASIAIWCTAATQAWKATERIAWHDVPVRLRRRGILVVTLSDMLNTDRDRSRLMSRLQSEAAREFAGLAMVNAAEIDELRRSADLPDHDARWIACGGEVLDQCIARLMEDVWDERRGAVRRVLARLAERSVQGVEAGLAASAE